MTHVLVVCSLAFDTLETPFGRRESILGGSATHFSLSASHFAPVRLVGVVGKDFPDQHVEMLRSHKIDTTGLVVADGLTFRWHGRFEGDMSRAQTLSVALNVLQDFQPRVPADFADSPFVLLGNASPLTQKAVLEQLRGPRFVMLDTMDFWITSQRQALLDLMPRVDALCINHQEAQQLADAGTCAEAIRKLIDLGAKALIVKRGEHGATLATPDYLFSVPTYPTERVVDPTGAGDSFAGGVLGYLAQNGSADGNFRRALVHGAVMGSLAVEEFGTERIQKATRAEIDARAEAILGMLRI